MRRKRKRKWKEMRHRLFCKGICLQLSYETQAQEYHTTAIKKTAVGISSFGERAAPSAFSYLPSSASELLSHDSRQFRRVLRRHKER